MPKLYNVTEAADRLGVDKSTVSRHVARAQLGERTAHGLLLTTAELAKVRRLIADARPGNPGPRRKSGRFK